MKFSMQATAILLMLMSTTTVQAQRQGYMSAIYSGVPWFDDRGQVVSAHGANLLKDNGRFYLFGEAHSDTSNAFAGFNCYSSADLYNWKFEKTALPVQPGGMLGPNTVGERPKVMKCPKTGGYVMLMHADTLGYKNQFVGYATAKTISGPYVYRGPLLYNGNPVRKWDMGTFQDTDGSGYLIIHGGLLYKLSDDYQSIAEQVVDNKWNGSEAPTIFKKGPVYFWLASDLTSWERNDNFYYTATSLKGPWTAGGNFAPRGTLTWNSQATFVLPITGAEDTTYLFMGDRWSYPHQASSATYVWQPLTLSGRTISIPRYLNAWQINTSTGKVSVGRQQGKTISHTDQKAIRYRGSWQHLSSDTLSVSRTDEKDAGFSVTFSGTQVGWYAAAGPYSGYAGVRLTNSEGKEVLTAIVDMYSKYTESSLRFVSPVLPRGRYTLRVTVRAEHGSWTDKKKTIYGSKGNFVSLEKIVVNE
jgi:hypothetical protein